MKNRKSVYRTNIPAPLMLTSMSILLKVMFMFLISGCSSPVLEPVKYSLEADVRSNKSATIQLLTGSIGSEKDSVSARVVINPNIVAPVYSMSSPEQLFNEEDQGTFIKSLSTELNRLGILKVISLDNMKSENSDISISIFFKSTYYNPRLGEYLLDVMMVISGNDTDKGLIYKYYVSSSKGDSTLEKMKAAIPREKSKAAQKLINKIIPDIENWLKRYEPVTNAQEYERFIHTYYIYPQPELIDSALKFISTSGMAEKQNSKAPILMSFSCLFSLYDTVEKSRWKSTINDLVEPSRALFTQSISKTPEEILNATKESPAKNDMNWACFFATGDVKYLNNIASTLKYLNERNDLNRYLTAASAKWSFASNSKSHNFIRIALEAMKIGDDPELRQVANEMLSKDPQEFLEEMKSTVKTQRDRGGWIR